MKNEKLKKETVVSEFDELTDEQLEKVLGGFVIVGKTQTTSFKVNHNLDNLFKVNTSLIVSDHLGTSLYTS